MGSLKGLENLTEVRGYMDIWENPNLASLDALANLERVDGRVSLGRNPKLLSEAGLESVMTVGGGYQDLNVADLSGSLLQTVASTPFVADQVDVWLVLEDDAAIAAVGDFVSKRGGVFSESLVITGYNVTSLENLSSLTRVDGDLYIRDTTNLTSLAGLQALAEVRGNLQILRNDRLTSLVGLEGLTSVAGELYFDVDDSSDAAVGLASLISTGEGLENVYGSDTLAPFAALFGEPILQSLQSLPDLIDKADILLVLEDDEMVSAVGDFAATRGGVFPGNLEITGDVTTLQGLEGLTEVRGHLDISENPQLTSLAGLESLRSVGGDFWVIGNDLFWTLGLGDSLQSLESVGGDLLLMSYLEME